MHKIDSPNATAENEFTDGDPVSGIDATELWAKWFNTIQREGVNLVESAGLMLDDEDDTQWLQAVRQLSKSVFVNNSNGHPNIADSYLQVPNQLSVVPTTGQLFVSIGPTGSGADNIWTALDSVPEDIDWIEVFVTGHVGAYSQTAYAYFRSYGFIVEYGGTPSQNPQVAGLFDIAGYTNGNGDCEQHFQLTRKIPVNLRRFLLNYGELAGDTEFPNLYFYLSLVGYGINRG